SSFTVPKEFPQLTITGINFSDKNNNNRIDGAEDCDLTFTINNTGKGAAQNIVAKVKNNSTVTGLSFNNTVTIGNIESGSYNQVKIPISGTMLLTSGTAEINVSFTEQFGFQPDEFNLQIETKEFLKPLVKVSDYEFYTTDGTIRLGLPVNLICLVQNIGQGIAEDVNVEFQLPSINIYPVSNTSFNIGKLEPGQQKELNFEFIANKLYTGTTVPVTIKINEKFGKFSESFTANATVNAISSTPTTIAIRSNVKDEKPANIQIASLKSDVDKNIPQNPEKKPNRYALIIGNEDYQSHQTGLNVESNVEFAKNDALIFKEYVKNTLGVKEENIYCLTDATTGAMWQYIELVSKIVSKTPNAELIFYYAGHGYPDENTKDPYLIPVDVNATNISLAIKLSDVYKKFSETGAKRITIFLDACFSGGAREMGLIAGRNVKIVPKAEALSGNMIVFAASSGEQSALPYKEVKHGMFTYFLLKKLQETKGNITYKELADYLTQNVSIESLKVNQKDQDPKVNYSKDIEGVWGGWAVR
ncbi:MAG TPA: caspase family protein, partial [Bacilli bacterium]|nr:caspase family protein [Bacilli bacterium]